MIDTGCDRCGDNRATRPSPYVAAGSSPDELCGSCYGWEVDGLLPTTTPSARAIARAAEDDAGTDLDSARTVALLQVRVHDLELAESAVVRAAEQALAGAR